MAVATDQTIPRRRVMLVVGGRLRGSAWLLAPALLFVAFAFAYPVATILARSFSEAPGGLSHYQQIFQEPAYVKVLMNTLRLSAIVTIVCLALGFPFAYAMTIDRLWLRRLLLLALLLPLWTSLLVRTYAWLVLLDRKGIVNEALTSLGLIDQPLELVHNGIGVTIGMVQILLPFMVLPLYAVMRNIDGRLVAAARSLGAPPVRAFTSVYVPLALPGIAAGCILVFIISIGYYITPALLGGAKDTVIAQLIANQIQSLLNWGLGAALSAVLLVVTLGLFLVFTRIVRVERIGGV